MQQAQETIDKLQSSEQQHHQTNNDWQQEREDLQHKLQQAQATVEELQEQRQPPSPSNSETRDELTTTTTALPEEKKKVEQATATSSKETTATVTTSPPTKRRTTPPTLPEQEEEETAFTKSKLEKLRNFRRSRELELKGLVLDSQNSPTDVQTVITNLQEELKAAKEVIFQQRYHLYLNGHVSLSMDHGISAITTFGNNDNDNDNTQQSLQAQLQTLQQRVTQLECDRAWGEFQLRDRITNDGLKFHRRLAHWKESARELQTQLEESMERHASECSTLQRNCAEHQRSQTLAEQDLQEYKRGTAQTIQELCRAQDRIASLEQQLEKYRPAPLAEPKNDPECLAQATFIQVAKERKEDRVSWGSRFSGLLHRQEQEQRQMMG